jgi:hypothetical protein
MSVDFEFRQERSAPRWGCALRILRRFYVRLSHRVVDVNPHSEHSLILRLMLCPSGGW